MTEIVEPHIIKAIVRHYRTAGDNRPYRGTLNDEHDEDTGVKREFNKLLETLPDGTAVTITIEAHGIHTRAERHVWTLVAPNSYARIPVEVYEKMREAFEKNNRYTWNKENYLTPLGYDNFICTKCHAVTFDTDWHHKDHGLYLGLKERGLCEKCARGDE